MHHEQQQHTAADGRSVEVEHVPELCVAALRRDGEAAGAGWSEATLCYGAKGDADRAPPDLVAVRQQPCPPGKYAVGDVYFAELAVYRYICSNADELFKVGEGELTRCDVDERAYHDFAERMMRS